MRIIVFSIISVLICSCTINKEKYTSGLIGCPEEMIEVTSSSGGFMANTWTAECDGRVFYCTYRSGSRVDCTESQVIAQAKPKPKPKPYGHWPYEISKIACLTGRQFLIYDDTMEYIKEGAYDKLAKDYKWSEQNTLKIIRASTEIIGKTTIYILEYKSGLSYIKYRVVYGEIDKHKKEFSAFDKRFREDRYKPMHGEVYVGGEEAKGQPTCWGLSARDRLEG